MPKNFSRRDGPPAFPNNGRRVLCRPGFFATGREKACPLLGLSAAWKTKTAIMVGCGLSKAGNASSPPRPGVPKDQLTKVVTANGWANQFAPIALISWARFVKISFRTPTPGQTKSRGRADHKAKKRRHMASGFRKFGTCICEEYWRQSLELRVPQPARPVCQHWPAVARRAHAGESPSPGWTAGKVLD